MKFIFKKRILLVPSLLVVFFTIAISCEKEGVILDNQDIYFPVGRISVLNNCVTDKTNNSELIYETVYDSCGGYWLKYNSSQFEKGAELVVDFTRTNQQTEEFMDDAQIDNWLKASYYIDCEEEDILSKALEITEGLSSNMEKAKKIQQYVIAHVEFNQEYSKSFDIKASKTLEQGCGTCMNFSRLYVALCRAAGLPARTIWGIIYSYEDNGIYDNHHQWAEVYDEAGIWHTCDFNYTRVYFSNNMNYLDLIYAPEENSIITGNKKSAILLKELEWFHDYPVALTGRLGFNLIADNRPDSMVVEYVFKF